MKFLGSNALSCYQNRKSIPAVTRRYRRGVNRIGHYEVAKSKEEFHVR